MPFSSYIAFAGSPCDSVYESGKDYVFIRHDKQFLDRLRMIADFENQLEASYQGNCVESTIRLICHYYLPPCGNSADFTSPAPSVCGGMRRPE